MNLPLKKHWPLLGVGLLGILAGLYLIGAPERTVENSLLADAVFKKGLTLEDIHYSQDNPDDRVKWFLDAKEATLSDDKQVISFRSFKLRVEPLNRPHIKLEGNQGAFYRDRGEIHLQGDLRGSTDDGYGIVTESAVFSQVDRVLRTHDPVKLIGPFFSLEGRGLLLNVDKETLLIPSDVTALIDKGFPTL